MSNVSQELLHELLRHLRQRIDRSDMTSRDVRAENTSLRRIVTAHQQDIGDIFEVLHRIEDRLDRIEARLNFVIFRKWRNLHSMRIIEENVMRVPVSGSC